MFDIGSGELLLILLAVLVFFGPRKIPELAKSLGKGIREFKKAQQQFTDQITTAMDEEDRSKQYATQPTYIQPEQNYSILPSQMQAADPAQMTEGLHEQSQVSADPAHQPVPPPVQPAENDLPASQAVASDVNPALVSPVQVQPTPEPPPHQHSAPADHSA